MCRGKKAGRSQMAHRRPLKLEIRDDMIRVAHRTGLCPSPLLDRVLTWVERAQTSDPVPHVAGNLKTGSVRCGNPTPNKEKELFGSSTDPYRCVAWLAAHDSFSRA